MQFESDWASNRWPASDSQPACKKPSKADLGEEHYFGCREMRQKNLLQVIWVGICFQFIIIVLVDRVPRALNALLPRKLWDDLEKKKKSVKREICKSSWALIYSYSQVIPSVDQTLSTVIFPFQRKFYRVYTCALCIAHYAMVIEICNSSILGKLKKL